LDEYVCTKTENSQQNGQKLPKIDTKITKMDKNGQKLGKNGQKSDKNYPKYTFIWMNMFAAPTHKN
jgi:hypothetical protein